jgi:hypothetical protein
MRPTLVSVSGFSSEAGKTSLLCDLLTRFPGWEAIKVTRGHYRSCGKDPDACCVSGLLSDKPIVLSGRSLTYKEGKDTGRFWDSGASNVHWVVGTSDQIEHGVMTALERVKSDGVLVEGNGFLKHVSADFSIMVANPPFKEIKSSAAAIMRKMNALYIAFCEPGQSVLDDARSVLSRRCPDLAPVPIYFRATQADLFATIYSNK